MARISADRLALYSAVLAAKGLAAPCATGIPRRPERERAPLSEAQERLFFLELYEPGTPLHNDAVRLRIEGELDEALLARALLRLAERHEILRTSFVLAGGGPEQRIHAVESAEPALATVDLAAAPDPAGAARARAREEARRPFDLERGPPWRATLLRLGPRERWLVLVMHHIVSDGASMGLVFDELAAGVASPEAPRPPLAVQFADYAAWERAQHDPARAERDLAFWRGALARDVPACAWPARLGAASHAGAQVPMRAAPGTVAQLEARARAARATTNHWLLAAWLALLARESGARTLLTGTASSLRRRRELEPLIGFFVQTLPLCVELDGDPAFVELVERVRAAALAAQEHERLSFERIARAARSGPLELQTFFSHMHGAIRPPAFPGARTTFEFVDPGVARFELALVLHEDAQDLVGFLEYDLGVFAPGTAERLAGDYLRLLAGVLAQPELRLSALDALRAPREPRRVPRRPPPRRGAGT